MSGQDEDEVIEIVLEMIGRGQGFPVAVRKVPVSGERVKLVVDLPSTVDAEEANLTAALVLDELDRLPPQARIAGILMASVQFTAEGASGLQAFLSSNADNVRHLALHNLLTGHNEGDAKAWIVQVCQSLSSSPLQVLDVSKNTIVGSSFWKVWDKNTSMEQIILDGVTLDTPSWKALAQTFAWDRLEDLHVVLQKGPDSSAASEAAHYILCNCIRLSSLRWIQRSSEGGPLPCEGFKEMARNMLKVNTRGGSLRHLVVGGSFYPGSSNTRADDIMNVREWKNLCSALQDMPRLRTLKLRSLGINEVERLVNTLRQTRPPLEVLDLSYNMMTNVQGLLDLVNIPKVNKEIRSIILSHNMIDTKQGRELFATFGDLPVDLSIDNNKVDFGSLIRGYQEDLKAAERERDDYKVRASNHDSVQDLIHEQDKMVADIHLLQEENKRLQEERDALMRAFSIMGASKQVEEEKKLLDRVQRLEDMVTLGAVFKPSHERAGERRKLDAHATRRMLVGELPFQMERLRSVSSRSIGSSAGANRSNRSNRSHSNRSYSTADMTDDIGTESPSSESPAPPGAHLVPSTLASHAAPPPILFKSGSQRNVRRNNSGNILGRSQSDRRILTRQLSNDELMVASQNSSSRLRTLENLEHVVEHGAL